MTRWCAQLLVRELLQEPECQRVLVVGAGVSGVTLPWPWRCQARGAGPRDQRRPTRLQGACDWRYVGPFMYEWPSHFFDDQTTRHQAPAGRRHREHASMAQTAGGSLRWIRCRPQTSPPTWVPG